MFANPLLHRLRFSLCQQQVRFARKTFRFQSAYGEPPLITEDQYLQATEENQIEDLAFKQIRFARLWELNSPLYDLEYETFCRYVMMGGRKELAYDLMHKTFYHVKRFQYLKFRKALEKKKDAEAEKSGSSAQATLEEEEAEIEMNPMAIFKGALTNCAPVVVCKPVKRGGAIYQVPYPMMQKQSEYLAKKWLIRAVLDRPKPRTKSFQRVMAQEILDAFNGRGKVVKRRDDMHRLADSNKAYAHYRWG